MEAGKVFKFELESQTQEVIYLPVEKICLTEIVKVVFKTRTLKITDYDQNSNEMHIAV